MYANGKASGTVRGMKALNKLANTNGADLFVPATRIWARNEP